MRVSTERRPLGPLLPAVGGAAVPTTHKRSSLTFHRPAPKRCSTRARQTSTLLRRQKVRRVREVEGEEGLGRARSPRRSASRRSHSRAGSATECSLQKGSTDGAERAVVPHPVPHEPGAAPMTALHSPRLCLHAAGSSRPAPPLAAGTICLPMTNSAAVVAGSGCSEMCRCRGRGRARAARAAAASRPCAPHETTHHCWRSGSTI